MPTLYVFFYCLFLFSFNAQAQYQPAEQIVENVQSSLVEIRAVDTKTFNEKNGHTETGTYNAQGSGVIIDSQGIIVTNTHIVANTSHVYVGLSDGKILEAKIIYSSDADFSFLKVDPPYPLTPIRWADSASAQKGTPIITLSYADDTHQHVLGGEIIDLITGASSNNIEAFELNINLFHGDSGGPLLDNQGQLLGLIMGKQLSEDNKSYAIASNKIQQEYLQYKQNPQN